MSVWFGSLLPCAVSIQGRLFVSWGLAHLEKFWVRIMIRILLIYLSWGEGQEKQLEGPELLDLAKARLLTIAMKSAPHCSLSVPRSAHLNTADCCKMTNYCLLWDLGMSKYKINDTAITEQCATKLYFIQIKVYQSSGKCIDFVVSIWNKSHEYLYLIIIFHWNIYYTLWNIWTIAVYIHIFVLFSNIKFPRYFSGNCFYNKILRYLTFFSLAHCTF